MVRTATHIDRDGTRPGVGQLSPDALIERYVEECTDGRGRHRSWINTTPGQAVPIWILASYLRYGKTAEEAAADYNLSAEEMAAAVAYYTRHQDVFDAWLTLNSDANAPDS